MKSIIVILCSCIVTLLVLLLYFPDNSSLKNIDITGKGEESLCKKMLGYTSTMRLHTVEYTVSKVLVMKEDAKELIPGKRRLAIPLTFTITGYIDLRKITADNFSFENGTFVISLPEAEVDITGQEGKHTESVSWYRAGIKDDEYEGELLRIKNEVLNQYQDEIKKQAREEFQKNISPYLKSLDITSDVLVITKPAKN